MNKYGASRSDSVPDSVDADFDRLNQLAPSTQVSEGLAEAFRSRQTPPFATMLSQLFERSPSSQKSNVLNTFIATLGPALVSHSPNTVPVARRPSCRPPDLCAPIASATEYRRTIILQCLTLTPALDAR